MSGDEQKYIQQAFSDNWVAPLGPNVDLFESMLETWYGNNTHIAALASGTSAVHLGLLQLGVQPGDEVICQSFTFCASANPITYCGAKPIFVDSEPETWNMSPELLEEAIKDRIEKTGRKPKAIIPVHLYGMPAKMDEIQSVAQKYDIAIMEDAAEAQGSQYKGKLCGTFGEFGAMSFNGNKMISTSGGGALICKSAEAKAKTIFYATQAREPHAYYEHKEIGYNYRLSNICAGVGCGQMSVLDAHIAHHRHVHNMYVDLLADVNGIKVHSNPNDKYNSNYWLTTILVDSAKFGIDSSDLNLKLNSLGIESRPLWKPMHLQPIYKNAPAYVNGVSENLFKQGLCLPSGPCVTDNDVKYIVRIIKESIIR
ncbi:MAG: DegT/DnrJ/EryC1/StrS family aminotransferase [Salinivirgaceae bacterium]|nr:DegT/DnrJ/EryC1/StrS family aminotransferase [Salinivirgaceae bacterium]